MPFIRRAVLLIALEEINTIIDLWIARGDLINRKSIYQRLPESDMHFRYQKMQGSSKRCHPARTASKPTSPFVLNVDQRETQYLLSR